jgi:hypothetical protein
MERFIWKPGDPEVGPAANPQRRRRAFSIGEGEQTIRWRAGAGFDDPTGAVAELIREGKQICLTPTGPCFEPADRPDHVAFLTAAKALRELVLGWRYDPHGPPAPELAEEGTDWIHAELERLCWLPPGAVG